MRQKIQANVRIERASKVPLRSEKLRLQRVRQNAGDQERYLRAHESAQWHQESRVSDVWHQVRNGRSVSLTHQAHPFKTETVYVLARKLFEKFCHKHCATRPCTIALCGEKRIQMCRLR